MVKLLFEIRDLLYAKPYNKNVILGKYRELETLSDTENLERKYLQYESYRYRCFRIKQHRFPFLD